jgi:hypothetical protein
MSFYAQYLFDIIFMSFVTYMPKRLASSFFTNLQHIEYDNTQYVEIIVYYIF